MKRFEIIELAGALEIKYQPTVSDIIQAVFLGVRALLLIAFFIGAAALFYIDSNSFLFALIVLPALGWVAILYSQVLLEYINEKRGIIVRASPDYLEVYGIEIDRSTIYRIEYGVKEELLEVKGRLSRYNYYTFGKVDFIDRRGESITSMMIDDPMLFKTRQISFRAMTSEAYTDVNSKIYKRRKKIEQEEHNRKMVPKKVALAIGKASGIQVRSKYYK